MIRKRRCEVGLGNFPLVSLKEARAHAFANPRLARAGGDPLAEKRRARRIPTFAEAAARVLEQKRAGWRNPKHAHAWPASLKRYVFPRFGDRPVSEVTSGDVFEILKGRRTRSFHRRAGAEAPPARLIRSTSPRRRGRCT